MEMVNVKPIPKYGVKMFYCYYYYYYICVISGPLVAQNITAKILIILLYFSNSFC